ncbi:hypothetical protein SLEP1_g18357 [Rubroshorea leprosula]|uniref:Uncharacterized protein n=1 Tax=Rubroshorea leprosula TaxID=152421 RepID=A0AAV5J7Q5_9ROSI|nr:hypothetical protein SLEP1_g18357 [Rubroshorea leprosula]
MRSCHWEAMKTLTRSALATENSEEYNRRMGEMAFQGEIDFKLMAPLCGLFDGSRVEDRHHETTESPLGSFKNPNLIGTEN